MQICQQFTKKCFFSLVIQPFMQVYVRILSLIFTIITMTCFQTSVIEARKQKVGPHGNIRNNLPIQVFQYYMDYVFSAINSCRSKFQAPRTNYKISNKQHMLLKLSPKIHNPRPKTVWLKICLKNAPSCEMIGSKSRPKFSLSQQKFWAAKMKS